MRVPHFIVYFFLLLGATISWLLPEAGAEHPSWTATVVRRTEIPGIDGLNILDTQVPVSLMPKGARLIPMVSIRVQYLRPGWRLTANNYAGPVWLPDQPEFNLVTYLSSRFNEVTLVAKGPNGESQAESIAIVTPVRNVQRLAMGETLASVGVASLGYNQTGFGDFSSKTGIVSLRYRTPNWRLRLGLTANAFLTLLTTSSEPINLGPQFLGAKVDGTFLLNPNRRRRLLTTLLFGVNYLTMLSNGSPFGFANLISPEVGLQLRYGLNSFSELIGEARFTPIESLSQSGIDLNAGWNAALKNGHRVDLTLGYSHYFYYPSASVSIRAELLSLRLGYSL